MEDVAELYNYVSLMNVYSHLPDPVAFLTQLRALLRAGGELVLLTGNGGDLERVEYPGPLSLPDHLSFVGHAHLRRVLARAGYDIAQEITIPPDVRWLRTKNTVKRLLGRTPRIVRSDGRFHYIFVRARVKGA
jgi:2-polyprenyl-3-methyl-5-hydroxy-6-metoxy-1,4-benzoquinol methylase